MCAVLMPLVDARSHVELFNRLASLYSKNSIVHAIATTKMSPGPICQTHLYYKCIIVFRRLPTRKHPETSNLRHSRRFISPCYN